MAERIGTDTAVALESRSPWARWVRRSPLTSAELVRDGVNPELLAWLALRRASGSGAAKSGDQYFDWGHPTPSYLAGIFEELAGAGLLALDEEDPWGLQRVRITSAGQVRYAQLSDALKHTATPVSNP